MKFYTGQNVFDAALDRIRWLFDEFPRVVVNFSGGKDSTVTLHLALRVAEEKGRLPLDVFFLDQEAEWDTVIDYIRETFADPRIRPHWLQVPVRIFNATSTTDPWLKCWDPERESDWIRPKEPDSIHENTFGTDRFAELLDAYQRHLGGGQPCVAIAGVRAEESPGRLRGLTAYETYKGETWGKKVDPAAGLFAMYPLYDWSYTDIWKAIHDHKWPYCRLYDFQYQHGVPVPNMRVSNVHHETAITNLFYLQEIEGDTWNRIVARASGINSAGHLQEQFFRPKTLPPMFKDWREYRDHLIENLIQDEDKRAYFRKTFAAYDSRYVESAQDDLVRAQISAVLTNDYHGTKLSVFAANNGSKSINHGKRGGRNRDERQAL